MQHNRPMETKMGDQRTIRKPHGNKYLNNNVMAANKDQYKKTTLLKFQKRKPTSRQVLN